MALYDKATGLLGTHVTWDDVENEIQKSLGQNAKFGPNKTISNISEGHGFLSRIGIVDPEWQCDELHELPMKFAVKIITMGLAEGLFDMTDDILKEQEFFFQNVHNREVQIYQKLIELKKPNVPSLKVFGVVPFTEENATKGFLILEAVDDVINIHADKIVDDQLIEQILEAIASFHALTWDFAVEEESLTYDLYSGVWGIMFDPKFLTNCLPQYRALLTDDASAGLLNELEAAALEMEPIQYRRTVDTTSERTGMRRMLCHGDFWSCNMLFTQNNEGLLGLKSIIDFQLVHFGCAGQDLCRFMCSMLTKEQRNNRGKYLNIYYSHLTRLIGDQTVPFTIEQLSASVDRYMAPCSYIVATCMAALSSQVIARRKDEEKETARLAIADKVRGLITDLLEYHKHNVEAFAMLE